MRGITRAVLVIVRYPFDQLRWHRSMMAWLIAGRFVLSGGWLFASPLIQKHAVDAIVVRDLARTGEWLASGAVVFVVLHCLNYWWSCLKAQTVRVVIASTAAKAATAATRRSGLGTKVDADHHVSRVVDESQQLSETVDVTVNLAGSIFNVLFACAVAAVISPLAVGLVVVLTPLIVVLSSRNFSVSRRFSEVMDRSRATMKATTSTNLRSISGMEALPIRRLTAAAIDRSFKPFLSSYITLQGERAKTQRANAIVMSAVEMLVMLAVAALAIVAKLSLGSFFALVQASWSLSGAFKDLNAQLSTAPVHYGRIQRMKRYTRLHRSSRSAHASGRVRARALALSPGGLERLPIPDFDALPGQALGLYGSNGSGKSTLLHAIHGSPMAAIGQLSVWGASGLMPSHLVFPTVDVNALLCACKVPYELATTRHFMDEFLPGKMLTDDPNGWSDGERKKLAAFLHLAHDRPIVLMDEPLSGVDAASRERLLRYLVERSRDRVLIVVCHDIELRKCFSTTIELPGVAISSRVSPSLTTPF
ncbi:ABC transporter ATP-binding protein [Luteibacter sahnii]|uniref:ABC transporter ATP-binding protein n=1 Tax=Luteibacter sahnii TaxID=3021977 RepID=UPI002A6A725D|nr:ABC transporter ATP-binding protein [Luteibacter sp. PPL193]MDY1549577.1 ABC transporter ATP-binding protein [Luteibacter sp. PPL193]